MGFIERDAPTLQKEHLLAGLTRAGGYGSPPAITTGTSRTFRLSDGRGAGWAKQT
jgi:hypothetical protein